MCLWQDRLLHSDLGMMSVEYESCRTACMRCPWMRIRTWGQCHPLLYLGAADEFLNLGPGL